jgi:hypothetical protein
MTTPNEFVVEDICRICLESDENVSKLFTPCRCSGSIYRVHEHCLNEWISKTTNEEEKNKCTICNTVYQFTPRKTHALTYVCIAFDYSFITVSFCNYCLSSLIGFFLNMFLFFFRSISLDRILNWAVIVYTSSICFYAIIFAQFMHVFYVCYFYNVKKVVVFRKCYLPAIHSLFMGCLILTSVFGFNLWIDELNFALIAITSILLNLTVVILYKNLNDALSKRKILPYRTVENHAIEINIY